jgi:hypothetical protein
MCLLSKFGDMSAYVRCSEFYRDIPTCLRVWKISKFSYTHTWEKVSSILLDKRSLRRQSCARSIIVQRRNMNLWGSVYNNSLYHKELNISLLSLVQMQQYLCLRGHAKSPRYLQTPLCFRLSLNLHSA